jgi:demethylmenaquinone methyltransferase/2-methoxy-6-polyprenyl-1,4-benzoquinol methylase
MALDKRPARVAAMFDAIAGRYDFLNHLLSAGLDRRWRTRAIRSLRLTGHERVVDVCTGTGDVALAAVGARPGASQVVGVDFSGEMLRLGREKVRAVGEAGRVVLVRGDATSLPLPTASMDAATVAFGIRNVEQPERGLAEMYRVLRPGGRLAILEFSIPSSALVRAVYLPYFRHVLPRIGRLVSGHGSAYTYLPVSVGSFIAPEVMLDHLRGCGFLEPAAASLSCGIVTLYTAQKQPGSTERRGSAPETQRPKRSG